MNSPPPNIIPPSDAICCMNFSQCSETQENAKNLESICDPTMKEFCRGSRRISDNRCKQWCNQPRNKGICDNLLLDHCRKNQNQSECGCALPQESYGNSNYFGPPECVHQKCANSSEAIRLSSQLNTVCNVTNCVIDRVTFNAVENEIDNIDLTQWCGTKKPIVKENPSQPETENKFPSEILYVSIAVVVLIALIFLSLNL